MNPLNLNDAKSFKRWADAKRKAYELRNNKDFQVIIDINADGHIPTDALSTIREQVERYNFALYKMTGDVDDHLRSFTAIGEQVGLKALDKNLCASDDKITKLTVVDHHRGHSYIPYSNKAIGWHTDGYYNPMHQRVLGLVLHCEQPAAEGGVSDILDHDMVYIHLRETNPDFIKALSEPDVMCIPENIENGIQIRPQTCSAVFLQEENHTLSMRFSRRKHNIIWAEDSLTQEALSCLNDFLDYDSPYHINYRLKPGEGVICNNVLHTRSAFTDDAEHKRVYYRARYYNQINF